MKLEVPYYSQFVEIKDEYWKSKACGMACLKMVLDFYSAKTPPLYEMVLQGEKDGGHIKSGWLHDYSIQVAKSYGLEAMREEKMEVDISLKKIKQSLEKKEPVIVSVLRNLSEENKFHQVVLVGFEEKNGEILGFYYHDPDSEDNNSRKFLFAPIDKFLSGWRKMAIFVSKK